MSTTATDRVLNDIRTERTTHAEKGYGEAHDDAHDIHHLVSWSSRYAAMQGKGPDAKNGLYDYDRQRLVQAASLLVAAIEAMDRQETSR